MQEGSEGDKILVTHACPGRDEAVSECRTLWQEAQELTMIFSKLRVKQLYEKQCTIFNFQFSIKS